MTQSPEAPRKILIIDCDSTALSLLSSLLSPEFSVKTSNNAKDGIHFLHSDKPDLIILDINLGESFGIDTAQMIKLDPENKEIPIMFISALSSPQDKIASFNAGACDFISKPFTNEEVLHKVRLTINFHTEIIEKNQQIDDARKTAFAAMAQSGEIGQVLHFIRDSFECNSFEKMGGRILAYMESQQLKSVILIKNNPNIYFSHTGKISALDKQIVDKLSQFERIIDFGKRSVYNFDDISLLIKDMPIEEEGLYGRIKDNVCLILEAADAKIRSIKSELAVVKHHQSMSTIIESSELSLKAIEKSFFDNAIKNTGIMLALKDKIEGALLQLGLTLEQEAQINQILAKAESDSNSLYESGLQIEERISSLAEKFTDLASMEN